MTMTMMLSSRSTAALVALRRTTTTTWASRTTAAAIAATLCTGGDVVISSTTTTTTAQRRRSFSSNSNSNLRRNQARRPSAAPNRLRRPSPSASSGTDRDKPSSPGDQFGLRRNAITLFPGDFSDRYEPQWDNNDEDHDDEDWEDEEEDDESVWSADAAMKQEEGDDDDDDDDDVAAFGAMKSLTRAFAEKADQDEANRKRWIENAKPPVLYSVVDDRGRAHGSGGRKTATASAYIQAGCGEVVVNGLDFINYFIRPSDREHVLQPLVATDTIGQWDVTVTVQGGGLTGQAGAARLAIANALNAYNPDVFRPPLKKLGLLTRDARIVERKKIGRKKARKSPQWVRR